MASGDDLLDITDTTPSERSTDNIITLNTPYNIDATLAQHLYDGSIIQDGGDTVYDGIVNFGVQGIHIEVIQNGGLVTPNFWTTGLNADANAGISHRFMVLVRTGGADIDGRRLLGITREFGKTYSEFPINGTSRGNNVLALTNSDDLNNTTDATDVATWTAIDNKKTDSTYTVNGVNATDQADLDTDTTAGFSAGEFIEIGTTGEQYQILSIAGSVLTLDRNLETATSGGEVIYKIGYGIQIIDVNNDGTNESYYSEWNKASYTINQFYERMKYLSRRGTTNYIFGLPGYLFRGITHQITIDGNTGTFSACEPVSWTGGTGQMLAINSPTAGTLMWIQLLTGVAPTDGQTITGDISGGTADVNVTVTDRTIVAPFVGASTGSAIIGSYGLGIEPTDLSSADKLFDLTNTQRTPPNYVTFTVSGLIIGEDRVLVGPGTGAALNTTQFSLAADLTTDDVTDATINTTIPSDTPSTGTIRLQDDDGVFRRLHYSSYTGQVFTFDTTDGNEDFASVNATTGNNVFISYIDKVADSTTATFTSVYLADRALFIRVRDGGGTPIKTFETSGTLGSAGGSATAIRTNDT